MSCKNRLCIELVFVFVFLLFSLLNIFSVNYTWNAGANGNWNNQINWDSGDGTPGNDGVPDDNGDTAIIDTPWIVTMNIGAGVTVGAVTINNGAATLTLAGNLTIDDGGIHTGWAVNSLNFSSPHFF